MSYCRNLRAYMRELRQLAEAVDNGVHVRGRRVARAIANSWSIEAKGKYDDGRTWKSYRQQQWR